MIDADPITVYMPRDSAALAVGADRVARAIAAQAAERGLPVHIVRNGSRGLFWLEPLVEVETAGGRTRVRPPHRLRGLREEREVTLPRPPADAPRRA